MRRNKQIILTILITLILLILVWLAGQNRSSVKYAAAYAARCDIPAGFQITADQLITVEIPEELLTDSYLTDASLIVGQWTTLPIQTGELISKPRLTPEASGLVYPDSGPGRRLMTIELEAVDANGFWLAAGSRVDLFLIPRNRESLTDIQVLENVRIMDIFSEDGEKTGLAPTTSGGAKLICLDLCLEQVHIINNAAGLYTIRLAAINESATDSD
ncbi:MAG TPA: hypothetical protein DD640_08840 [Clostridiales bacterium]|nr:hypothetical protein [Clostridiales bacterium]